MNRVRKLLILLMLASFLASMPGCSGCWEDPIAKKQRLAKEKAEKKKKEQEEEEEEEKKKDFDTEKLILLPAETGSELEYVKPAHWTVANQPMVANNFDFRAQVNSMASTSRGKPLRLEGLPHALSTSRAASLPKDQWKDLELLYFPPRSESTPSEGHRTVWLKNSIEASGTGREVFQRQEGLSEMKSHEYFMVVLADNADDYGFLKLIHSTQPLVNDSFSNSTMAHYRVALPKIDRVVPLPSNALAWTAISVVVWDDLDPNVLTPDQQFALLDWLHFGGQLIVSGPRSYSTLKGSFLQDYLPVTEVEGTNLSEEDFAEMSQHWTITSVNQGTKQKERLPIIVPDQAPLLGLNMTPHPAAYWPPGCEDLVLERRIGRGRLCFTGFPLDADAIKNWPSFDSFVNAVLLRRPPRRYSEDDVNVSLELHYADRQYLPLREDPRLNSLVRFFSRDLEPLPQATGEEDPQAGTALRNEASSIEQDTGNNAYTKAFAANVPSNRTNNSTNSRPAYNENSWNRLERDDSRFGGWETQISSGVGGWNDFSGTGTAARNILRRAAGISVPKVDFVLRVLAIYLLVLAPLNWLIFRVIGRVELAWIAAPLIAIVGATAVIRMAQLDIGFARSHTDLAVLELHEGYRRAHLTRYTALYTSLGTNYELEFEDSTALALPFSADRKFEPLLGQQIDLVNLERGRTVKLTNFQVGSNTTGMVHSEQMYDCGGALTFKAGEGTVLNNTELTLQEAIVIRRNANDQIEIAELGTLKPASAKKAEFKELAIQELAGQFSQLFPRSDQENEAEDSVNLDRLLQLAVEQLRLYQGEARLVAWTDNKLSGLEVHPAASQYIGRSMILAHLSPAPLPEPKPDENLRIDFKIRNSLGEGLDVKPEGEAAATDATPL